MVIIHFLSVIKDDYNYLFILRNKLRTKSKNEKLTFEFNELSNGITVFECYVEQN